MEDYISVLLNHLSEQTCSLGGWEYASQHQQKLQAQEALLRTLSEEQLSLFLAYEEKSSACSGIREDTFARAAFLLAREVYR